MFFLGAVRGLETFKQHVLLHTIQEIQILNNSGPDVVNDLHLKAMRKTSVYAHVCSDMSSAATMRLLVYILRMDIMHFLSCKVKAATGGAQRGK